ncbi:chitobiase/beta-hexosaminidase C-terminal domain-containing protein, partial [Rheinheimera sp. NSM]|uniref:chitobiase/beta-hexosaminidase C-terminal domain-containing protein n=1 Tax=Rheinheimera sp. NSM TaxID=3457884 RepID=UPI004036C599
MPRVPSAGLVTSANSITVSWYSNTSPGPEPEPCQITGTCHCDDYGPCQPLDNPEPPQIAALKDSEQSVTAQSSAVSYRLQGYKDGAVWGSEIINIDGFSRSVTWSQPGAYTFKVRGCNSSGCSAYTALSNTVTISQVATPAATPNGGTHSGQVNVTLSTATAGAVIRYTLNNTAVTASSAQYTATIPLSQSTTIRAKAFKAGMADSGETTKVFTIVPPAPSKPLVNVSGTMINVVWDDVTSALGYQIQYKSATTDWSAFVTSNNGTGHSYSSLAPGKYQFRVRACNPVPGNCSAVSATTDLIDTTALPPATPDEAPEAHIQNVVTDNAVIGGTSGAFRVDESGAATYSIALQLPTGIAGNTPELSLNYHSSAGNGPVGIGWSIGGLSSIERCRQTPVQDGAFKAVTLTNSDRLCLDGQRLVVVSGSYGAAGSVYATEIDSQVKVTAVGNLHGGPEYFEVRRPDGSISYYGNAEDSRFSAASGPAISWAISEVTDLLGVQSNKIYYNYVNEGNEQLISSVIYSGNEVRFHYDTAARTDRPKMHIFGVNVMPSSLLESISVTNHTNALVRELRLEHDTAPLSGVARMLKITECGVGGSCLKPLLLEWNEAAESSPGFKTNVAISQTLGSNEIVFSQPADINGDGLTDWVYVTKGSHNIYQAYYLQGTGAGFRAAVSMSSAFSSTAAPEFRLANIYGDGSTSLLYYTNKWFICALGAVTCFATDITEKDIALHDITGNGQADIITKTYYKLNKSRNVFCLSPGCNSFHTEFGANAPLSLVNQEGGPIKCSGQTGSNIICSTELTSLQQLSAFDINGDGLNDFVAEIREKCNPQTEDCRGYRAARYWGIFLAEQLAGNSVRFRLNGTLGGVTTDINTAANLQLADLNGDGLADLLYFEAGRWHIRFYNQKAEIIELVTLPSSVPNADNAKFIQAVDVTGNGINELVYYHSGWRMLRHPYSGAPVATAGPVINVNVESAIFSDLRGQGKPGIAVTDFGNKRLEWFGFGAQAPEADPCLPDCLPPCLPGQDCQIIQGTSAQPYIMSAANQAAVQHQGVTNRTQDTVRRFIDGHGLSTAVSYSFLTNSQVYTRGFGLNLASSTDLARVFNIGGSIPVVSAVQSDTGQGAVGVTYKYEGARIQAGGRGFLGYEKLTSVDSQTGIISTTKYLQHFPFVGMPSYTKQEYNGKTISFARNMYEKIALNSGKTVYPYLKRSAEDKYAVDYLNGSYSNPVFVSKVTTENSYSAVAGRYVALDEITVATYDKASGLVRTVQTVNDYDHDDISKWLINRVSRSAVTHQQGQGTLSAYDNCVTCTEPGNNFTITNSMNADPVATVMRTAAFDYYPSGLLKDEITEPDGDAQSYLKTSYTYDALGNLETTTVSSKAGAGELFRISRYSENIYDSAGRYLISKNINDQTVASYSSFNTLGQAQTVTENGIRSVLRFNAFGQPVFSREQTPSGAVSGRYSIITRGYTTTAVGLPSVGVSGYSYERVKQGGAPTQWKVADAAGRELATITEAFNSDEYIVRQTQYDTMGRPMRVSQPAFNAGSVVWNQSDYDIFGRPVLLLAADGTRTDISYSGLAVTSKVSGFWAGASAQSKTEVKDAFGQLRSVTDAAGTMSYQYDATGNLLHVSGVDGEATTMTYNSRGHKQTMVDPDSGSWSYKYNALGELVEQTSPKMHITQTWYDDFGRKVTENILHGTATLRSTQWGYSDEAGHTVRNLVVSEEVAGGALRRFDYDALGRLERNELVIEGETLVERTTYDQYSRVFQLFDAGGNSYGTQYQYQNGYSKAVWEARYGIDKAYSVRYQNIIAMDAFGNVTESKAG